MPSGVTRPVTKKADPYEFDLPEPEELDTSRSSAMDTSADLEPTEDIAETEDEAEASDEEEEEEEEDEDVEEEDVDVDEDEREAQREAEAVADRWVGARVKKWFRLPKPRGRRKKGAPPPPDGEYVWGTVVETRARRMEVWAPHVPCAFVRYDDGDYEPLVKRRFIRLLRTKAAAAAPRAATAMAPAGGDEADPVDEDIDESVLDGLGGDDLFNVFADEDGSSLEGMAEVVLH